MAERKLIPKDIETHVLLASARRCALCYGFNGSLERKRGQLAHIDRNPSNPAEDNVVYLCMEHHDEYDSRTSQAKGITEAELREYKAKLVAAISIEEHTKWDKSRDTSKDELTAIRGHDERLFREADALMSERHLRQFLGQLGDDHSYMLSGVYAIDGFRAFFVETGHQFINEKISRSLSNLLSQVDRLLGFLAIRFFVFPTGQRGQEDTRLCLQPNLNIDRSERGIPNQQQRAKYDALADDLMQRIRAVLSSYEDYRMNVKRLLLL
jgi:hypothetical protein